MHRSDRPGWTSVILAVHGAGQSAAVLASDADLGPDAWARGIAVIYPGAVDGLWNVEGTSDVDYVVSLLDSVASEFCLDATRVFMAGMSQGGDFAISAWMPKCPSPEIPNSGRDHSLMRWLRGLPPTAVSPSRAKSRAMRRPLDLLRLPRRR